VISDVYQPGMVKVGSKWMYPEDEEIDGGTFEHRKRIKEMLETEAKAKELTAMASKKGAHHISDYLPKEVLYSFFFFSVQFFPSKTMTAATTINHIGT
jgi:hypothetical protein